MSGVGLTPMVSMLKTIAEQQPKREVTFIHGALNSEFHVLIDEVSQLTRENHNVTSYVAYSAPIESDRVAREYDKEGFVDLEWLQSIVKDPSVEFYFCGPVPFIKSMYRILQEWGVPVENMQYEFFGPAGTLEEETFTATA